MSNMEITPAEYVEQHESIFLVGRVRHAIENNSLPLGMGIDYAQQILELCDEPTYTSALKIKESK